MASLRINLNGNITIANESFYEFYMNGMLFVVHMRYANDWCWRIRLWNEKKTDHIKFCTREILNENEFK